MPGVKYMFLFNICGPPLVHSGKVSSSMFQVATSMVFCSDLLMEGFQSLWTSYSHRAECHPQRLVWWQTVESSHPWKMMLGKLPFLGASLVFLLSQWLTFKLLGLHIWYEKYPFKLLVHGPLECLHQQKPGSVNRQGCWQWMVFKATVS